MTARARTTGQTGGDRGSALLVALMVTVLLQALGAGLVTLSLTERLIASQHRGSAEVRYAAAAIVERAVDDLQLMADWQGVVAGSVQSGFLDASLRPTTPWGSVLDLQQLTTALQAESDLQAGRGADNPQWRVFASGPMSGLLSGGPARPFYLVAWVADDVAESDAAPAVDANGIVSVRGTAIGPGSASARVAATLAAVEDPQAGRTGVRVLSWREIR
jgi:hypothetical protein